MLVWNCLSTTHEAYLIHAPQMIRKDKNGIDGEESVEGKRKRE